MPSFRGNSTIIIQPQTSSMGYTFNCPICTSTTANDGVIPFDSTIAAVTTIARTNRGVVDTELVDNTTLDGNNISVNLSYPTTNGLGRYKLTFKVILSNGSIMELDYNRIVVKDV